MRSIALLVLALTASCGPKSGPVPGPFSPESLAAAKARWPDSTEASLAAGRDLFVGKCAACHGLPALDAVGEAKWPEVMKEMGPKASLDAAQTESVLRFVLSSRAK